jgi:hypothetical protein
MATENLKFGATQTSTAKIQNNPFAALGGAYLGFVFAKRSGIENKWVIAGTVIVTGVFSAMIMSKLKQKYNVPSLL